MSDRELLELAAKAAGYDLYAVWGPFGHFEGFRIGSLNGDTWDALEDDGDALRLATQLCMSVRTGPCEAAASTIAGVLRGAFPVEGTINQPQDVAVRRVIVRAAAEFGENM